MKALSDLIPLAQKNTQNRIAVVAAHDEPVIKSIKQAIELNLIYPILIGDEFKIKMLCEKHKIQINKNLEIINEPEPVKAAYASVVLVHENRADILMKGMVPTATLLKAILHKEKGIKKAEVLSHFALFESKYYHKLLGITDAAMNISPTLEEKKAIVSNAVQIFNQLGYCNPKVAILTPLEIVNHKIESTVHASLLKELNQKHEINNCIIDGPLALDNAISLEAAKHKGIVSDVAGDADILVVPDLNSGNILYKSLIFLGGASSAAVICGASVPVVLTSRSDSDHSKLLSIALAVALK